MSEPEWASPRGASLQAVAWALLAGFWVVVSRHNHPNLTLNVVASLTLTATFAAAVYANHLALIPRLRQSGRRGVYAARLTLLIGVLALVCTVAIHLEYDALWGPDPARFGFGTNLAIELALVAFHVGLIAVLVRAFDRVTGRRPAFRPR